MNWYLLFKALHIVGFVAWFAGLFYLVRMFVHHTMSLRREEPARGILAAKFTEMESLVYRVIVNPAMMITWTFGLSMLAYNTYYFGGAWWTANGWMHVKLVLLVLLVGYQLWAKGVMKKLADGQNPYSDYQFRLANEVPTLFLLAIVLLAVFRSLLNYLVALGAVFAFGVVLVVFTKWYKKRREARAA